VCSRRWRWLPSLHRRRMQVSCVQTFRYDEHLHNDNVVGRSKSAVFLTSTKEKPSCVVDLALLQTRGAAFGEHGGRGLSTRPPNLSPRNRPEKEAFGGLGELGGHPSTHKRENQTATLNTCACARTHARTHACVRGRSRRDVHQVHQRAIESQILVRWSGGRPSNGHPPDVLRRSRCPPAGRNRRACPEGPGGAA
jgi:hypothetical protein